MFNNGTMSNTNTSFEVSNLSSSNSVEYKRGYILRKPCLRANGKRVSLGKRKWKCFYAILRDTTLYLHKDDQSLAKNSIRIHHSVAVVASDYTKRKFVFRLSTADGSEFLINVNSKQEMDNWIESINFVAAYLSAPAEVVTSSEKSEKKKKYPLKNILPVNNTKYQNFTFKEQLNDHESKRIRINEEIQDITHQLRSNYDLVGKKAKNSVIQLKYLKHEYERYTQYCKVMKKVKQNGNSIFEKASKSLSVNSVNSKTLTSMVIGEELDDSIRNIDEE